MENPRELNEREKSLLTALSRFPDISLKHLLNYTAYRRVGSITRKLQEFKEIDILRGPRYDVDFGKLCTNSLHKLFCILETDQSHDVVISYLTLIEPLKWVYSVLSPHKKLLNVGFLSSDDTETTRLLQLLKDHAIITNYSVHDYTHKRIMENPDFSGDPNPSLDGLLTLCELSDISVGQHDTEWNRCDISILPYLEVGYKGAKLIEILRAERKVGRTWTYNQMKYSCRKMIHNNLIQKSYTVFPFPFHQCAVFNVFVKTEDTVTTRRILANFGKGERIFKECLSCGKWGLIHCISYPSFLTDIMYKLDQIGEIKEKELYQLRSLSGSPSLDLPTTVDCFDVERQTLKYPYRVYREKIKEKIDTT
jgi:hypothetical protein